MPHPGFEPREQRRISRSPKRTTWRRTAGDIIKGLRISVQKGVQETEGVPAPSDQLVIEEGNNTGEDGARAAGTVHTIQRAIDDNSNVNTNGRDIGEGTAGWVELAMIFGADRGEVGFDGCCLI